MYRYLAKYNVTGLYIVLVLIYCTYFYSREYYKVSSCLIANYVGRLEFCNYLCVLLYGYNN